jgi:hypothetical protein
MSGKYVEGSAHGQSEDLNWHLSGRIEENHEKTVRTAGLQAIIYEYEAHSNTAFNKFPLQNHILCKKLKVFVRYY